MIYYTKYKGYDIMKKLKKIILNILLIVFLITFIYSTYKLIIWYKENKKTKKTVEEIKTIVNIEEKEDETIEIDFNELLKKNSEVVGWIKINNTNVNYPILQHKDNSYYLDHSFDNTYNGAGWIFMDYQNNPENLDFNTIIYGHNRKDGSMFGSLFKTLDGTWIKNEDNLIIKLTTLNNSYLFKIFSIYYIDTTDDYNNPTYDEETLNRVINRSLFEFNAKVNLEDKILSLSTCYNDEKKLVIHAQKILEN